MATIGEELRAIRRQHGLSLAAIETKSQGRFKAVVVGSWERDDRHPPVESIRALLAFYGGYTLTVLQPGDLVVRPSVGLLPVPVGVDGWSVNGRSE